MQVFQDPLAQVPYEQRLFVPQDAADENDGVRRVLRKGKGDFDAVGDDREVGAILQERGDVKDGAA